jgi:hypothetical protein
LFIAAIAGDFPAERQRNAMPEDGFGGCDSHHEMVDFVLKKPTEVPLISLTERGSCRLPIARLKRSVGQWCSDKSRMPAQ